MVMTALAVLVVLGVGYIWLTRGFFSSLIHLICTVIAGAIAFAVWEPLSYALLNAASDSGFTAFLGGVAWALGLALPFAVSLAVLRLGVDKMLPANVSPGTAADYAGGGICGVMSGVIAAGILTISLSFLRMETEFFGATHVSYAGNGSIERTGGLLVPVDKITGMLYGRLSEQAFRVEGESLGRWHPNVQEEGAALRINFAEGKARNTARPADFDVVERFTVGEGGNAKLADLLSDRWNPAPQTVTDPNGQPFPPGSHIEGFIVNFKTGAKEKEGKTVVGNAQIRLLLESDDGEDRIEVYPVAVGSQAESTGSAGYARWRYDTRDTFIASVGAAAQALFAFEFVCPPNYKPIALYVKGSRVRVDEGPLSQPKSKFSSRNSRDDRIARLGGGSAGPAADDLDYASAIQFGNGQPVAPNAFSNPPEGVMMNAAIGMIIQKGTHDPMVIDEENGNLLVEGEKDFETNYKDLTRGMEKPLRIERFAVPADVVIIKVDVTAPGNPAMLGKAMAAGDDAAPVLLYDTSGNSYQPAGYIYEDATKIHVRYTPGQPISKLGDMPRLSNSRPDQKMTLIFRVSFGVQIKAMALGKKALAKYDPPINCNQQQGGR
ncbi:MAG: CvpA family protein [Planctomycetes bacterium]|nr:CvpA family protein [Planctomycetota bacterium]